MGMIQQIPQFMPLNIPAPAPKRPHQPGQGGLFDQIMGGGGKPGMGGGAQAPVSGLNMGGLTQGGGNVMGAAGGVAGGAAGGAGGALGALSLPELAQALASIGMFL